jgi:hypothetical protein
MLAERDQQLGHRLLGPDQVDRWGAADDVQLPAAAERCGLLGQGVGGSGHVGSFQVGS